MQLIHLHLNVETTIGILGEFGSIGTMEEEAAVHVRDLRHGFIVHLQFDDFLVQSVHFVHANIVFFAFAPIASAGANEDVPLDGIRVVAERLFLHLVWNGELGPTVDESGQEHVLVIRFHDRRTHFSSVGVCEGHWAAGRQIHLKNEWHGETNVILLMTRRRKASGLVGLREDSAVSRVGGSTARLANSRRFRHHIHIQAIDVFARVAPEVNQWLLEDRSVLLILFFRVLLQDAVNVCGICIGIGCI
mmetsp:Transcript_19166/g.53244  ORF Transcript_19166/g.53244 Transcript_19166/m.53244 type:complete len:247 (+) Transcript_19166:154-894(+)